MTKPIEPLEHTFELLRTRGASVSNSFSEELEDRLMLEQQTLNARSHRRPITWIAVASAVALISVATVGLATDGFKSWFWTVTVGNDGTVQDAQGNVVGSLTEHADGSSTVTIMTGPNTGLSGDAPTSMKGEQIQIGAQPYSERKP